MKQLDRGTLVLGMFAMSCAGATDSSVSQDQTSTNGIHRSWSAHPALIEVDQAGDVYAVSDAHGEYAAFAQLLAANKLINSATAAPGSVKWTGGTSILVIAGDLIDKGPESLEVIDLVRTLEASAAHAGGRVIATMGNHEAEFLLDPNNKKATSTGQDATGIDNELNAAKIDPKSLVQGTDSAGRGAWLAALPLGVRVKKWFFSHAGNSQRLSIKDLEQKLENSLSHNGFGDKDITGNDSILESQGWYGNPDDKNAGQKEADALGVNHIVFGHDPGAFGEHGSIRASKNGVLVKIDTAMGIHGSSGVGKAYLLHITTQGNDTAEVLDDAGHATPLL